MQRGLLFAWDYIFSISACTATTGREEEEEVSPSLSEVVLLLILGLQCCWD